jgi:hypothetical protein
MFKPESLQTLCGNTTIRLGDETKIQAKETGLIEFNNTLVPAIFVQQFF